MVANYYLRIERLTQTAGTGDPEREADPDAFDRSRFLHVYAAGVIPSERIVRLGYRELTTQPGQDAMPQSVDNDHYASTETVEQEQLYKLTLQHFTLSARKKYLLSVFDDFGDPRAFASHTITTKQDA
jgi:hypothetical protein